MKSQADKVIHQIDVLIDSGVTNKTEIYDKIRDKTGLPRSTIRRIAGQYKKQIERKIRVLTSNISQIEKKTKDPYYFIPRPIKKYWKNVTQDELIEVKCLICQKPVGYLEGISEGSIICPNCKSKFPNNKKGSKQNEK